MARAAELAGNDEDMMDQIKKVIKVKQSQMQHKVGELEGRNEPAVFSKRERDTIAVSFKNLVSGPRVAIRVVKCLMENSKYSKYESGLRTYKNKLEDEVFNASEMIVGLIRQQCIGRVGNSAE